jgi:hypothetical protein
MMAALCVGWFGLYGSLPADRLHFDGQRGLNASWVLHCKGNRFHQIVIIASKKLRHPYLYAARVASEPWYLCVFVLFFK